MDTLYPTTRFPDMDTFRPAARCPNLDTIYPTACCSDVDTICPAHADPTAAAQRDDDTFLPNRYTGTLI